MRNVFGGLSFNLTRVAAEGAPGTSSHDCYHHSGGRRGNLSLVPYISMCKILILRVCLCTCLCVLQLTVAPAPWNLSGRKHASCSAVTFDSLRSETAHQFAYYVLKNPPSVPKSKGGKIHRRGAALKLTAVIVLCHLVRLPGTRKGLIFYDVW